MVTLNDYATPASLATNAACPQRPVWQLSPVGYKWAQAVFVDYKQDRACNTKARAKAVPKLDKIWEKILFQLKQTLSISRGHARNLSWMSVF